MFFMGREIKERYLKGNTYAFRDEIKKSGGKWDAQSKMWLVPIEHHEKLQAKIDAAAFIKPCANVKPSRKDLSGQLWEECRRCGNEPVYISLNCLCENCG